MSIERVLLAAGHRLGTVGLLLVAAGVVLLWREERAYWYVLPVGFLVGDLGFVCGFGAWVVLRREQGSVEVGSPAGEGSSGGEGPPAALRCAAAWGAMMFNAGVMGVAGMLMILAWLHW